MISKITKRSGEVVSFDANKITMAIEKAGSATKEFGRDIAEKLTVKVLNIVHDLYEHKIPSVEQIQDIVEEVLLNSPYKKTAKAYILYREQHAQMRKITSSMSTELVDNYIYQNDWKVKENSNMTYSLQGLNNYLSSEVTKMYWLNKIYPPEVRKSHIEGDYHIHDLSSLSVYCVGWDLYQLLLVGFKGSPGKIESLPAKHFRTALGHINNFFFTLQGEAAGAQAFSSIDTLLAPFIHYDGLDYKAVKQSLQEFTFNLNVPTRVGFQTPFTNLTFDLEPSPLYKDMEVVIGGTLRDEVYGDFQDEMDMFNRAFLEVLLEGDAKSRVFSFPIPTYNITRDFNWDNENLELLWEVTAKFGVPYFANFVNSELSPEDARSMCCRLRLNVKELRQRGGGLFGSNPLTGSIGVVTINMPRIGYYSKDETEFIEKLDRLMILAKNSLEIKRKFLEKLTEANLYPYSKYYLRSVKERFGQYWSNHFSTIGIIGMNEACLNLLGCSIADEEGYEFSKRVLDYMSNRLIEFQQETGHYYNLEATPAEGTSYRLAKIDKKKNPKIICANESNYQAGRPAFYTNSTHLPVNYSDDIFEILNHQDKLQCKYTG
ncbi:MAG: ribonucleoside triphosphate reductase, partial [Candidatus Heimdallarchaeaceae archaeon]